VFQKGYLPNWTHEVFEICERYPTYPVTYGLRDLAGESIKRKFDEQEIQRVEKRDDDLFEIEKILNTRKRGSRVEYYVKWKGYPEKFNSWTSDLQ
jgi:predicted component of type VI protein secretion system